MQYVTKKTSELVVGDVVWAHGLRCVITDEPQASTCHPVGFDGSRCLYTAALVLNRSDVPASAVPMSFTRVETEGEDGELCEEHRWTIQGNDLATWYVEEARFTFTFEPQGGGKPWREVRANTAATALVIAEAIEHRRLQTAVLRSSGDPHAVRMADGGDATFGRTDDDYEDPRSFA